MQPKKHVPPPWFEDMDLLLGITNLVCAALVLLSGLGYGMPPLFGGRQRHMHALIPGGLGLLMGICTAFLPSEKTRKAAAHILVLVALLGVIGAIPGLMKMPSIYYGFPVDKKEAAWIQFWMFLTCAPFVVFCIMWFIANKKAAKAKKEDGKTQ